MATNSSSVVERYNAQLQIIEAAQQLLPSVIIIHDLETSSPVYMSKTGLQFLNITLEELQQGGPEYHSKFFNQEEAKEYVPKILGMLERNYNDESLSFFQQVRPGPHADWTWFLSSTKIFLRNDDGRPLYIITVSNPIDDKHQLTLKVQRLLEENNFLRSNQHLFATLTPREIEVLKLTAKGLTSSEMAEKLFISELTVQTHRRNLREKLKVDSNYDLTRFAQAFDLL